MLSPIADLIYDLHHNHSMLIAKVTAPTSVGMLTVGVITKSNITWSLGVAVALISIYGWVVSISKDKAEKRAIRQQEKLTQLQIDEIERKNRGHWPTDTKHKK